MLVVLSKIRKNQSQAEILLIKMFQILVHSPLIEVAKKGSHQDAETYTYQTPVNFEDHL